MRMMRASFVFLLASGLCGVAVVTACVGDDPVDSNAGVDGGGGTNDSSAAPDAGTGATDAAGDTGSSDSAAPRCDPNQAFGTPTTMPFANVNSTMHDTAPYLSDDEKTMWFGRGDPKAADDTSWDIYVATREDADGVFGAATQVVGALNVANKQDDGPVVTADGLRMFFTAERGGLGDIHVSTRETTTGEWSEGTAVPALSVPDVDVAGDLRAGELWFYSSRDGGSIIYHVPTDGGSFGTVAPQGELGNNVHSPRLTRDGKRIFYNDPADDILTAVRGGATGAFTTQGAVPNINSTDGDRPGWVSADGCRLYFFSTRTGGKGGWDIYMAQRLK